LPDLNYEGTRTFSLTVSASDGSLSSNATATVNLTNVNEAPTLSSKTLSLAENSVATTAVGALTAIDPDGDSLSYSITAGNTDVDGDGKTAFAINTSTGAITVNDAGDLNFEDTKTFSLTVNASDGALTSTSTALVNLTDINATGDVYVSGSLKQGETITATVSAQDADGVGAFTYHWLADGLEIASGTSSSYALTQRFVGHALSVTVSYVDGSGNTELISDAKPFRSAETISDWKYYPNIVFAPAEMNGDGKLDLAGINGNTAWSFTSDNSGKFRLQGLVQDADPYIPVGGVSLSVGDFNADGISDLVYGSNLLLSKDQVYADSFGPHIYKSITLPFVNSHHTSVADFDRDGNIDILGFVNNNTSQVYWGNGDGTFSEGPSKSLEGFYNTDGYYLNLKNGDFNSDGIVDILFTGLEAISGKTISQVFLGNGLGNFQKSSTINYDVGQLISQSDIAVGDFNNDSYSDYVALGKLWLNDKANGFNGSDVITVARPSDPVTGGTYPAGWGLHGYSVGDIDLDGNLDVIAGTSLPDGNHSAAIAIAYGDGNGGFSSRSTAGNEVRSNSNASSILVDVNGDGILDILSGIGEIFYNAATKVSNINDTPTGFVTVSGSATQGNTLTVANTLADIDGIASSGSNAISYQWLADGVAVSGATGTSLTLAQAQVGKAITVTATYTDLMGTAESVKSSATGLVNNVNDLPTGSIDISGSASLGQTLTAAPSLQDADGMGAISYQWKANGVNIAGATKSSFLLGNAQVGSIITVTGSYTDGFRTKESVTSAATNVVSAESRYVFSDSSGSHYYEIVLGSFNWDQALSGAAAKSYNGVTGYLATVTSIAEQSLIQGYLTNNPMSVAGLWLGASDSQAEGAWKWVTGPEAGTQFWSGDGNGSAVAGAFSNWDKTADPPQPNTNSDAATEDYLWMTVTANWNNLSKFQWGDAPGSSSAGYIVEYSTISQPKNNAPTGSVSITGTAAQNQTLIVSSTLVDADGLGTLSYQWSASGVAISGATGSTLTLGQAQVGKAISVTASYTDLLGSPESISSTATTAVTNVNEAPTLSSKTLSLPENSVATTAVDGDSLSYSITAGNTDVDGDGKAAFAINTSTGAITVNDADDLNYEGTRTFSLSVNASDGALAGTSTALVNLTDINETPSLADRTLSLAENSVADTSLGSLTASDPDNDNLTYSITGGNTDLDGDGKSAFAINTSTGAITVNDAGDLNFEGTKTFSLTVSASDGSLSSNATATVNLTNVNEAPTLSSKTLSLAENSVATTAVGALTATDPEGDSLTYSIAGGNTDVDGDGKAAFAINTSTGAITVNDADDLNYEGTRTFSMVTPSATASRLATPM